MEEGGEKIKKQKGETWQGEEIEKIWVFQSQFHSPQCQ